MTASFIFQCLRAAALGVTLTSVVVVAIGCTRPSSDTAHAAANATVGASGDATAGAASVANVTGEFLPDGSCRATVDGAALFAPSDSQRTTYDPGPVADIAPAGYALHQIGCAPAGADASSAPEHAGDRMVLVTVYAREGTPLRPGRYIVRPGLATDEDSAGVAMRTGIAIFGAPSASPGTSSGTSRAGGVRYLEGRAGTLTITSADGERIVGTFTMRAGVAWSM